MNIDLHSHFFPIDALGRPGKHANKAPKIRLDNGKLTVACGGGVRGNLAEGAYDAAARIEALDAMHLAAMLEGDMLRTSVSALRRLFRQMPVNTAALRRRLADSAVARVGYPL